MKFLCKIFGHRWKYERGILVDSNGEQYSWTDWMALHNMITDLLKTLERRECTRCGLKEEHEIHQFSVSSK